ncbi:peptidoglycan DD-metalloendopeptidase family protein [Streptomyces sp. WMMC500]|uniref:M23 family metallopeptidase n=1 Tax=Streptomyces sp. WMMC500 TaxID=3015154 RepID=UPI00248AFDCB|nr:peptidoglycan DD-metalloendopeptidase family protein [Streptomyces sp. WMMC500]WBB63651.1 peptidoglycan DD-metalloendopeptidase family protein [Streptomyces sp. WMMC500]
MNDRPPPGFPTPASPADDASAFGSLDGYGYGYDTSGQGGGSGEEPLHHGYQSYDQTYDGYDASQTGAYATAGYEAGGYLTPDLAPSWDTGTQSVDFGAYGANGLYGTADPYAGPDASGGYDVSPLWSEGAASTPAAGVPVGGIPRQAGPADDYDYGYGYPSASAPAPQWGTTGEWSGWDTGTQHETAQHETTQHETAQYDGTYDSAQYETPQHPGALYDSAAGWDTGHYVTASYAEAATDAAGYPEAMAYAEATAYPEAFTDTTATATAAYDEHAAYAPAAAHGGHADADATAAWDFAALAEHDGIDGVNGIDAPDGLAGHDHPGTPDAPETPRTPDPAPRAARKPVGVPVGRAVRTGRRRCPKRSALLTVAVPSIAVVGVAGVAAASVSTSGSGGAEDDGKTTQAAPDGGTAKASKANAALDTQLRGVTEDADDFADRASRTQERIDLKEKQEAERKREAAEAARKEALRPKFAVPVASPGLSAYYGQAGVNWMSVHTGIDFPVSYGSEVMAATDGTVTTRYDYSYGNMLVLTAADGTETWYAHLDSYAITTGPVQAGDVVAYSGNSGNSTGPHLHFEVHPYGGGAIDPLAWLQEKGLDPQ